MSEEEMQPEPPAPGKTRAARRARPKPGSGPIVTSAPHEDALHAAAQARADQIVRETLAREVQAPMASQPAKTADGKPERKSATLKEAMQKVQARANKEHAERARLMQDPELRQLERQGYKVLPPTGTRHRSRSQDPTVIMDADQKHVGHEGFKKRLVPAIDRWGTAGEGEKVLHDQQGWVPVRYREDDPKGRFKAGDIAQNGMGVMYEISPDDYAELWMEKHPAQGLDPATFAEQQAQRIIDENPDLQFQRDARRRNGFRDEKYTYHAGE